MAEDQNQAQYRFARDVSQTAPKVGHQLATLSFPLRGESVILWVIEGPANDAVGLLGMATDFRLTRLPSFSFHGPLLERLNQMPPSPYDRGLTFRFAGIGEEPNPIPVQEAIAVFSGLRATGRPEPDSAAIDFDLRQGSGERVRVFLTGYQRGWLLEPVIVAAALSLWVLSSQGVVPDGETVALTVDVDRAGGPGSLVQVSGAVTFRDSITGASAPPVVASPTGGA